jgi:glutathione S-transferase
MRLHVLSGSPYAWRVQLVLEEKGLPYDRVLRSAQQGELRTPEYLALSPHGKVPALEDGDVRLYESTAIAEYLEEQHPAPPLLPEDPAGRAAVRIEELECLLYFADGFFPGVRQRFFVKPEEHDQAVIDAAQAAHGKHAARLEQRAAARGGPFLLGETMTRADLTWIPFVEIAARGKMDLDPATTPWLVAWRERMRARPSYDASYPPHWRS